MTDIGNQLYWTVNAARFGLFQQAEMAELTFAAFQSLADRIQASEESQIKLSYPVGYRPDRTTIPSEKSYSKDELLARCVFLGHTQLASNAIVQLATIMEAMFGDVVRHVVLRFPEKIDKKRTIRMEDVLQAGSLEELHLRATDALLGDLSYKSPADFAEAAQKLLSCNLLECPAFHKYTEMKATRDIVIHNRGLANDTYIRKAGAHARVQIGQPLPIDVQYFLESYEACIQVTEWLEKQLHDTWYSSEHEAAKERQQQGIAQATTTLPSDAVVDKPDDAAGEDDTDDCPDPSSGG